LKPDVLYMGHSTRNLPISCNQMCCTWATAALLVWRFHSLLL